jgi:hypothetical protein
MALVALAPAAKAQATSPEYLFVVQPLTDPPTGSGIVTYIVDPTTGSLTPSSATPLVPRTPITGGIALNPAGTYLFAVSQFAPDQSNIGVFNVGANGQLTETTGSPYNLSQAKAVPVAAAVSPQGKYLYVASSFTPPPVQGQPDAQPEALLDVLAIADDGSLTVSNTIPVAAPSYCPTYAPQGPTAPVGVYLHPTRNWFYLLVNVGPSTGRYTCDETAEIQQFTILSDDTLLTGGLLSGTPASVGAGISGSPDGTVVFVSDGTSPTGLVNIDIVDHDSGGFSGGGNYIYTGSAPLGNGPGAAVDSTSTYFYTPSGTFTFANGVIGALHVGANVFDSSTELASPVWPFIFAASTTTGLNAEQVNTDGSLAAAPGSPTAVAFATQANPNGMVLTGATPLPNTGVLWISPTSQALTGTGTVGQTGGGVGGVTITNPGFGPLFTPAITFTGDPILTLANNCPAEIAPGNSCGIGINAAPVAPGTFTGSLSVGTQTYPISFTANYQYPEPYLAASPNPLTFPDEKPGTTSAPLTVTFTLPAANNSLPLVGTGLTITGANAQNFSQTNNCTVTLQPGQSCTATVTFSATAVASDTAQLNFTSSSPNYFPSSGVTLNGNGATNPAQYTLTLEPNGNGTITSSPAGSTFTANTVITVTAVPKVNGAFQFWNPGCNQSSNPVCTFPITENTAVGAVFNPIFPVSVTASGPGTVVSEGGAYSYGDGSAVFEATANYGASITGWSGPCASAGTNSTCIVTGITGPVNVTVTFTQGPLYTVTPTVNGPGTVTMVTQAGYVPYTNVGLLAVPAANATFRGWTAGPCAKSPNASCYFQITGNTAVTANFSQKYTLETSVTGSGTIEQSPPGAWFDSGTSVTLTAVPGNGAGFGSWTKGPCSGSTNPVCTFTVATANVSATAAFNGQFTLSTTAIGPGTITQSPAGSSFAPGTMVTLTAVPNTGATFTSWAGVCAGSTNPVCTFALNANTTATATFAASTNLTLTTNVVGPGTITQTPTGSSFASGTSITLTANPTGNATFSGWSGNQCSGGGALNPTCTFSITANTTVTATFTAPPTNYTLTTTVVGPGTISQNPSGTSFQAGVSITLTAMPSSGATFTAWSGGACNGSASTTCTFAMPAANTTVTATFAAAPKFTLTTAVVGPGTITQTPTGTSFASGTSITLIAVPTSGDTFTAWSGGACNGSTNATCTFAIVANTTVTATFAGPANYTLATNVSGPGTITQSPTGTSFASGTSITLTAVPNSGATFVNWAGACAGSTNAVCTFAISANTTVTATFAAAAAVTPSQPSQSGGAGSAFRFTLNTSGFTTTPTLSAICNIPDGSCTISGTTLTVTTTARTSAVTRNAGAMIPAGPPPNGGGGGAVASLTSSGSLRLALLALLGMLAMWTLGASARTRNALRVATLTVGLVYLAACGGGGGGGGGTTGTPAGTYTVTVTAMAGNQTATTKVTVTVN